MEKVNHKAINLAAARLRAAKMELEARAYDVPCDYCGKALRPEEALRCHPGTACVAVYCAAHIVKYIAN